MSAPTPMEACLRVKRSVPSPARSRPSVITGRSLQTAFEENGAKSDGADNIISGGSTTPSFGDVRGVYSNKKNSNLHKVAQALAIFFFGRDRKLKFLPTVAEDLANCFRPAHPPAHTAVMVKGGTTVSNQKLDCTPQAEPTTEKFLRFARAIEALGKHISGHLTKDNMFEKEMTAYGRPMGRATCCPTHLDSAPPPLAVCRATTDWISHSAVHSVHRLRKFGLPGFIAYVQGEPDIHSAVGLPRVAAYPLMNGCPVPLARKQSSRGVPIF